MRPTVRRCCAAWAALSAVIAMAAGPTAIVKADRTNIRAKPAFDGEVLATLKKGDTVEVVGAEAGTGVDGSSPKDWTKVALPPQVAVWVYGPLVDGATKTVKGKSLNLRAGPGRNYSEIGLLPHGATVAVVRESDGWLQIEPPAGTYAFVASNLIERKDVAAPAGATTTEKAPAARPAVAESTPLVPAEVPGVKSAPIPPVDAVAPAAAAVVETTAAAAPALPLPAVPVLADSAPRGVLREGILRRSWNANSPGNFELRSTRGEGTLDFLVNEDPSIDLAKFKGKHVFVTGEEWRDARWKLPVLKVKTVESAD
ncbi:MAG: SH3 domain-containing protein [Verrucomicrobiota bacterium]